MIRQSISAAVRFIRISILVLIIFNLRACAEEMGAIIYGIILHDTIFFELHQGFIGIIYHHLSHKLLRRTEAENDPV
jgi:hypothetical protein